jgi:phage terminase large subunit-like protein
MMDRNIYFMLATDNNSNQPGIRPNSHKMVRFNIVVPWFKAKKMYLPLELKDTPPMQECINELQLVSPSGMKSKHDDFIDTISMLSSLTVWRPSDNVIMHKDQNNVYESEKEDNVSTIDSYVV